ncbi:MAG: PAS domain S-box protein [Gemmatimonadales bacterium]
MNDHHRSRNELVQEIVALRKQVADLRLAAQERLRVEAALRESEARYRAWLEELPVSTGRLTATGRLVAANDALAQLLGYADRAEALQLIPVLGLFSERGDEVRIVTFLRERRPFHGDASLRAKDGTAVPATAHVRPIRSSEEWTITLTPKPVPDVAILSVQGEGAR